jgi:hypothetical protein
MMNLLCPHCQRLITIPDEKAGQITNCPLCQQAFPVPALPQTASTPYAVKSPPAAPESAGSHRAAPAPQGDAGADVFALAPEQPAQRRTTTPPPQVEQQPSRTRTEAARPAPAPKPPLPPPPGDYQHTYSIWISPHVIPLIAPLSLGLVFVLMFFPWTGSFPGGRLVYTQTLFQAIAGTFTTDAVGDRVLNLSSDISKHIGLDWLAILYFVLWLLALAVAVVPVVMRQKPFDLPPALREIWPWRSILAIVVCVLVLVVLLTDAARGFGLENALARKVDETLKDQLPAQPTDEETAKWNVQRGAELGRLQLHRTSWFRLAELLHLLAIAGVSLELWLERRGTRPTPRIDFRW